MKNVIELLAARLPAENARIERELAERYAIRGFQLAIGGAFLYNVQCYDALNDFQCAWGNDLTSVLEELKRHLTLRDHVARDKREKAAALMKEAEEAERALLSS